MEKQELTFEDYREISRLLLAYLQTVQGSAEAELIVELVDKIRAVQIAIVRHKSIEE